MLRRTFVFGGLATLATAPIIANAKAYVQPPTSICLHHTHTQEIIEIDFLPGGDILPAQQEKLNHFLRDHRTEQACPMDTQLFSMLYELQRYSQNREGVFEIISAYRSPKSNALLRRHSEGVARHSKHIEGKALDIRLRGTSIAKLRALAAEMNFGGLGYYPRSNFVHIDTGDVRYW